jgi:hypothetical protein
MKPLTPPNNLYFQAAQGWLELGDHIEANEELDKVTASLRAHPAVARAKAPPLEISCAAFGLRRFT